MIKTPEPEKKIDPEKNKNEVSDKHDSCHGFRNKSQIILNSIEGICTEDEMSSAGHLKKR
jgi:hypothetical protein